MERRKTVSAQTLSTKSARNPREVKMIEAYNAALIGSARTINRYGMGLDDFDIEEAGAEAGLAVLLNANFDRPCKTYAWRCGQSSAIETGKRATREKNRSTRLEDLAVCWKDDEEFEEYPVISDDWADGEIIEKEEEVEANTQKAHIWDSFGKLTEKDQTMYLMLMEDKSYKEIASALGCTENSLYKRRMDGEARFIKQLNGRAS